jgi:hypothetical protein
MLSKIPINLERIKGGDLDKWERKNFLKNM